MSEKIQTWGNIAKPSTPATQDAVDKQPESKYTRIGDKYYLASCGDGVDDYLSISEKLLSSGNNTIGILAAVRNGDKSEAIVSQGKDGVSSAKIIKTEDNATWVMSPTLFDEATVQATEYSHVIVRWSGGDRPDVWLDGVLQTVDISAGTPNSGFGGNADANMFSLFGDCYDLDGMLAEASILSLVAYDKSLSDSQVASLANHFDAILATGTDVWDYEFDLVNATEVPQELHDGYSSSSMKTMFNENGHIFNSPTNLLYYSQDFSKWDFNHDNCNITYDQENDSYIMSVTEISNSSYIQLHQYASGLPIKSRLSAELSPIACKWITLGTDFTTGNDINNFFHLEGDGAIGDISSERILNPQISLTDNGTYIVSIDFYSNGDAASYPVLIRSVADNGVFDACSTGDVLRLHRAWLSQSEPYEYYYTNGSAYSGPRWNACHPSGSRAGWLLETEASTNRVKYSQDFNDPDGIWYSGAGEYMPITLEPDNWAPIAGRSHLATADGSNSNHRFYQIISASGDTDYCCSLYVAPGDTGEWIQLRQRKNGGTDFFVNFNTATGKFENYGDPPSVINNFDFVELSNGWKLFWVSFKSEPGTTSHFIIVQAISAGNLGNSPIEYYDGDFRICGIQFEKGFYPSSYIPTDINIATRDAESLSVANLWQDGSPTTMLSSWSLSRENSSSSHKIFSNFGDTLYIQEDSKGSDRLRIGIESSDFYINGLNTNINSSVAACISINENAQYITSKDMNDVIADNYTNITTDLSKPSANFGDNIFLREFKLTHKVLPESICDEEIRNTNTSCITLPNGAMEFHFDSDEQMNILLSETGANGYSYVTDCGHVKWVEGIPNNKQWISILQQNNLNKKTYIWPSNEESILEKTGEITFCYSSNSIPTFIDFGDNPSLDEIQCDNNNIASMNISRNANLSTLSCHSNPLTNLNISDKIHLKQLLCNNCLLDSLVFPSCSFVGNSDISYNNLTSLRANNTTFESTSEDSVCLNIKNNSLSSEALNQFFSDIGNATTSNPNYHSINILDNPGTSDANIDIAINKGYDIIGGTPSQSILIRSSLAQDINFIVQEVGAAGYSSNTSSNEAYWEIGNGSDDYTITISNVIGEEIYIWPSDGSPKGKKDGNLTYFKCQNSQLTYLDISEQSFSSSSPSGTVIVSNNEISTIRAINSSFENTSGAFSCNINNNNLDAAAINQFFDDLADVSSDGSPEFHKIFIGDNPGEPDCDKSIAENKGYSIVSKPNWEHEFDLVYADSLPQELLDCYSPSSQKTMYDENGHIVDIGEEPRWNSCYPCGSRAGWLLETDPATNHISWSEDFLDIDGKWIQESGYLSITLEPDNWAPREGRSHRVVADGQDNYHRFYQTFSISPDVDYCCSVYVAPGDTGEWIQVRQSSSSFFNFNTKDGKVENFSEGSLTINDYGFIHLSGVWKIFWFSILPSSGATSHSIYLHPISDGSLGYMPTEVYSGDFRICAIQFEKGLQPSSYIPTSKDPVDRESESLDIASIWPDDSPVTMLSSWTLSHDDFNPLHRIFGDSDDMLFIQEDTKGNDRLIIGIESNIYSLDGVSTEVNYSVASCVSINNNSQYAVAKDKNGFIANNYINENISLSKPTTTFGDNIFLRSLRLTSQSLSENICDEEINNIDLSYFRLPEKYAKCIFSESCSSCYFEVKCKNANGYTYSIQNNPPVWFPDTDSSNISINIQNCSCGELVVWSSNGKPSAEENGELVSFATSRNDVFFVDITNLPELEYISLYDTETTFCDISNNTLLSEFSLRGNKITSIDTSYNPLPPYLSIYENNISNLTIYPKPYSGVSNPPLNAYNNNIKTIQAYNSSFYIKYYSYDYSACALQNNDLNTNAINQFFSDLAPATTSDQKYHVINLDNNPGVKNANIEIAENKGYRVFTTPKKAIRILPYNPNNTDINLYLTLNTDLYCSDYYWFCQPTSIYKKSTSGSGNDYVNFYNYSAGIISFWANNDDFVDIASCDFTYFKSVGQQLLSISAINNTALTTFICSDDILEEVTVGASSFIGYDENTPFQLQNNNLVSLMAIASSFENTTGNIACNISNNNLDSAALNKFFTYIKEAPSSISDNHKIDIRNNPGTDTCDVTIAENKGYMVITS